MLPATSTASTASTASWMRRTLLTRQLCPVRAGAAYACCCPERSLKLPPAAQSPAAAHDTEVIRAAIPLPQSANGAASYPMGGTTPAISCKLVGHRNTRPDMVCAVGRSAHAMGADPLGDHLAGERGCLSSPARYPIS